MKKLVFFALIVLLLGLVSCDKKATELTEVSMKDLRVPQDFNYEMNNTVDVNLQGAWRLPVYIKTTGGNLLFKAQMSPENGLSTKLILPKTIKEVVVEYQTFAVTVNVRGGNLIYNFREMP
jgi:hypothetical protein